MSRTDGLRWRLHLLQTARGVVTKAVIGNYTVRLGQGLGIWTGLALAPPSWVHRQVGPRRACRHQCQQPKANTCADWPWKCERGGHVPQYSHRPSGQTPPHGHLPTAQHSSPPYAPQAITDQDRTRLPPQRPDSHHICLCVNRHRGSPMGRRGEQLPHKNPFGV